MMATTVEPLFEGSTGRNTRGLLRLIILCTIAAAAIASRLFSVIRTYALSPQLKYVIDNFILLEEMVRTGYSFGFLTR